MLWSPHAEFQRSLEEKFVDLLNRFGIPVRLSLHPSIDEQLIIWRDRYRVPKVESILNLLRDEGVQTQDLLANEWMRGLDQILISRLRGLDLIEPLHSRHGDTENRFDAFSSTPVETYLSHPSFFRKSLESLSSKTQLHEFLGNPQSRLELALLMLLTHNHLSEDFLIMTIAANEGLEIAWQSFLALNAGYEHDHLYWRSQVVSHQERWRALYSPSEYEFVERWKTAEIALDSEWGIATRIPFFQRYHFYGVVIMAYRLHSELKLPHMLVEQIVAWLGQQYKRKTFETWKESEELIKIYYRAGPQIIERLDLP